MSSPCPPFRSSSPPHHKCARHRSPFHAVNAFTAENPIMAAIGVEVVVSTKQPRHVITGRSHQAIVRVISQDIRHFVLPAEFFKCMAQICGRDSQRSCRHTPTTGHSIAAPVRCSLRPAYALSLTFKCFRRFLDRGMLSAAVPASQEPRRYLHELSSGTVQNGVETRDDFLHLGFAVCEVLLVGRIPVEW